MVVVLRHRAYNSDSRESGPLTLGRSSASDFRCEIRAVASIGSVEDECLAHGGRVVSSVHDWLKAPIVSVLRPSRR